MLPMYVAQQCFGLSDEGIEDAIYDSQAMRRFIGIDLGREAAPDATTLLKFRRRLEQNQLQLNRRIFEVINGHLAERGLLLREGTVVDAAIIAAPPSTKNRERARDPEMHQAKKGDQWHFGMKAHIGTDAASGLVHSLATTPANAADITQAHRLLHGEEREAFADSAYQGVAKRAEFKDSNTRWYVAMKRGLRKALRDDEEGQDLELGEQLKAKLRVRVEHPFHMLKNRFEHRRTRYQGLAKNEAQCYSLFGLANLVLAARRLLPHYAPGAS